MGAAHQFELTDGGLAWRLAGRSGLWAYTDIAAIRLSAQLEGMIVDPVYEGKSMQGLIDLVRKGFFPAGSKILYAHLGGAPALNGYSYTFRNG